jgi:hypothetical protein
VRVILPVSVAESTFGVMLPIVPVAVVGQTKT